MHNLSTDGFRVTICKLDLQHVKQKFYTFKCRVRSSGLVLDCKFCWLWQGMKLFIVNEVERFTARWQKVTPRRL